MFLFFAQPLPKCAGAVPVLQLPAGQAANVVGNRQGFSLVVRDQDRRVACGLQNVAHLLRQVLAGVGVQVGFARLSETVVTIVGVRVSPPS